MKIAVKRLLRDEKGQTLILALILLTLGGLVITTLLGLMGTGLITGQVYQDKMNELYAADAGVEDGLWQIKNDQLCILFPNPPAPPDGYDEYAYFDYDPSYKWEYDLPGGVNGNDVRVTIGNVWVPLISPVPDPDTAKVIALGTEGEPPKLIITGGVSITEASKYEIKISYEPGCEGPGDATVTTIGIWLPPGFEYDGDCSLEGEDYYSEPVITPHKGGCAVVWDFGSSVLVRDFPKSFTFQYLDLEPQGQIPGAALSWIDTTEGYTWDADVKVYEISSTATDPDTGTQTTVESYTSTIELRKLGSAISGDYHAIGNTLLIPTGGAKYRNRLFRESGATVVEGDIPSNARIEAAFLYWSGWIEEGSEEIVVFEDNCYDFIPPPMDWTNGSAWSIHSGEFRGNAYYDEPTGEWQVIWGPETCGDFVYPPMNWDHGSAWDISNGRFRGTAYNKYNPGRYVTTSSSIDLSAYAGQTVEVSWQQYEDGDLEDSDRLYFAFNNGSTWSADYEAFRNDNPPTSFTYTIPNQYLTDSFRMRFYLYGFNEGGWWSSTEYCYIDNIEISAFVVPPSESPGRYLTMNDSIDLSAYTGQTVEISWNQHEEGDLEDSDRLYYAFSADGGSTWSSDYEAFRDDNPPGSFNDTIPNDYLTDNFRMRFYLYGFEEGGGGWWSSTEYCYIDNIIITVELPPVEIAKVNRVMFNGNQITTDQWQVEPTPDAAENSWCYSCFYDATDIVINELGSNMNGSFTLGHVLEGEGYDLYPTGTTHYPLATPAPSAGWNPMQYEWTYAGWSLLIIYSSPETKGHQLYLFDTFRYVAVHTTLDFPISGFLVPDPVEGEEYAAHLTCFVGDGDEHYPYDFIALLDAEPSVPSYEIPDYYKLWDGINCDHNHLNDPNNVWNSQSTGLDASGIDIDNFDITWSSGLLQPGDTSAWVMLGNASSNPSDAELIMVVYIIISFRSDTTSGGIISYLITG